MDFTKKYERWHALFRWVFVLYFCLAPRVVGHRHADLRDANDGSRVLANHLERCHNSRESSVPESQFHFHLTFLLLPSEIPGGMTAIGDVLSTSDTTAQNMVVPGGAFLLANDQAVPRSDAIVISPKHLDCDVRNVGDVRRILFGVWQI